MSCDLCRHHLIVIGEHRENIVEGDLICFDWCAQTAAVDKGHVRSRHHTKGIRAKVAKGSLAVSDKTSIAVVGVQRDGALTDDMVVLQIFGNAVGFTPILKGWAYFNLLLRSRSSFFLFISLPRIVATSA